MTSPYSVAPTTAPVQERRPTYEDLKLRAEQAGFLGGRGVMDTREWYELCYFTPLESFLYTALLAKYSGKMDGGNISVCLSTWIYAHSVSTPYYKDIIGRNLRLGWFDDHRGFSGKTDEELVAEGMKQTLERGFISLDDPPTLEALVDNGVVVTLRSDIEQFLTELVDKECAENDADIIATYGKEAFDELTTILKKSQELDDRRHSAGLS